MHNMLTQDKVTEIFCIIDDFCKEFLKETKKYKTLPSKDGKNIVIALVRCLIAKL